MQLADNCTKQVLSFYLGEVEDTLLDDVVVAVAEED